GWTARWRATTQQWARTGAGRTAGRASVLHPQCAAEPHVALQRISDIGHPVPDHERALDAEPEREAAVAVRVDPAGDEHLGVDHPGAGQLDPALRPAHPARVAAPGGGAAAGVALHGHVDAGPDEREEVRPDPGPQPPA